MWYQIGEFMVRTTDTRFGRALFAAVLAVIVGGTEVAIHVFAEGLTNHHRAVAAVDGLLIAAVVFFLTYIQARAVTERRGHLVDEFRKVADLNHNVRNALQQIQLAAHVASDDQLEIINSAVEKIDLTIRRL